MSLCIGMITADSSDPLTLGRWWADRFSGSIVEENEGYFVIVDIGAGAPRLGFQKVDDATPGKNKLHLDLIAADAATEVAATLAAGATQIAEHSMEGFAWTILADPEGNQFCIAQR